MHDDGVVLLHGILRTRRCMAKIERHLRGKGYRTLNIDYPSTRYPIEECAAHIRPAITEFAAELPGKVHFVGFSMGGLVIRSFLHQFPLAKLGRVVLLSVPNQGSELADFLRTWWLYKKLFGPAGQQLVTGLATAKQIFGQVTYEVGCIGGDFSLDPLSSWMIGIPNDGRVSIASSKVDGMTDHVTISASHTFFPRNRHAMDQALHFIKEGKFLSAC